MKTTMTIKDALIVTESILKNIWVPSDLIDQIGIPVRDARKNILQCIEAIARNECEKAETGESETDAETTDEQQD